MRTAILQRVDGLTLASCSVRRDIDEGWNWKQVILFASFVMSYVNGIKNSCREKVSFWCFVSRRSDFPLSGSSAFFGCIITDSRYTKFLDLPPVGPTFNLTRATPADVMLCSYDDLCSVAPLNLCGLIRLLMMVWSKRGNVNLAALVTMDAKWLLGGAGKSGQRYAGRTFYTYCHRDGISTKLWRSSNTWQDLSWESGPIPPTNAGPPTKPFNTRTYRSIRVYRELSNPMCSDERR